MGVRKGRYGCTRPCRYGFEILFLVKHVIIMHNPLIIPQLVVLRNEFNFSEVHEGMNRSGSRAK